MSLIEDDDDVPQLSADLLAAIADVKREQEKQLFAEDWQLSQFWYDDETALALAEEAVTTAKGGRIIFVSAPTAFRSAIENFPEADLTLLEFDRRFGSYGDKFHFYDYKDPLGLPETLKGQFDFVIADPPFLSEECLHNAVQTMKWLRKNEDTPLLLCTGAVMEAAARREFATVSYAYQPKHKNRLQNEFACFGNYKSARFGERPAAAPAAE